MFKLKLIKYNRDIFKVIDLNYRYFFSFTVANEREITEWREADIFFVETHTFENMLEKVWDQPFMTFVGAPGSGKTATARHIALKLQEKGYKILPIKDICHIETYCDPHNPQVFVIDDVLGSLGFDMSAYFILDRYSDKINSPTMPRTKVLMTCREVVFRNEHISLCLFDESNVILLNGEEHGLNVQDKQRLLLKYKLEKDILNTANLSSTSNMFPLLCKFYSTRNCFKVYGPSFFIKPVPSIFKGLDELSIHHKVAYASLVLLMANQNRLSKSMLDNTNCAENANISHQLKSQVLAACKVESRTESFCFINALSEMVGTYTKSCDSVFTFIHESLLEIVAYHFGSQNPNLIIQYMNSDFIANNIKLETYADEKRTKMMNANSAKGCYKDSDTIGKQDAIDLCIKVSNYKMLAERLYTDVKRGELYNVFGNEALKHSFVLDAFIDLMEREPYEELHSVFLSQLKTNVVKHIYDKIKRLDYSNVGINFTLVGLGKFYDGSVRAISWVIFYGHNRILQSIKNRVMEKDKHVDSLFTGSFKELRQNHSPSLCNSQTVGKLNRATIEHYRLICLGCYSGDLNIVNSLLSNVHEKRILNGEIDCYKMEGMEPLVIACFHGYLSIAKELINAGASVNLNPNYWTPLAAASTRGHLHIVKELIKAGADVNIGSPLDLAKFANHNEIVKTLKAAGANDMKSSSFQKPHSSAGHIMDRFVYNQRKCSSNQVYFGSLF